MKNLVSIVALAAAMAMTAPALADGPVAPPPAAALAPQAQQPNVLIWLLDDIGFAQLSSFGGLVPTPNIDRVAAMGLRYSNYHTSAIFPPPFSLPPAWNWRR